MLQKIPSLPHRSISFLTIKKSRRAVLSMCGTPMPIIASGSGDVVTAIVIAAVLVKVDASTKFDVVYLLLHTSQGRTQ